MRRRRRTRTRRRGGFENSYVTLYVRNQYLSSLHFLARHTKQTMVSASVVSPKANLELESHPDT
jgi:hypothetical protein